MERQPLRDAASHAERQRAPLHRDGGGLALNYARFRDRVQDTKDYELGDLRNLLCKDQEPDLKGMIDRVCDRFRFLEELTERERLFATDNAKKHAGEAEALIASLLASSA